MARPRPGAPPPIGCSGSSPARRPMTGACSPRSRAPRARAGATWPRASRHLRGPARRCRRPGGDGGRGDRRRGRGRRRSHPRHPAAGRAPRACVLLAMAWSMISIAPRGSRAAERLDPQHDPCLRAVAALTRARFGQGPESPSLSWRRAPIHAPRHLPELPGEAITLPSFLLGPALQKRCSTRDRSGSPRGARDAFGAVAHAGRGRHRRAFHLARRRSLEEVASFAPEPLAGRVAGAMRRARVMAGALDLLGARVARPPRSW